MPQPLHPIKTINKVTHFFIMCLFIFLSGCGGSDSDDDKFLGSNTDINVALASSGSSASANYNNVQASKVIDGDTSTSEYWSGNVTDDYVTVNFGQSRLINQLSVYTSDTSFSSSQPNKLIQISADGTNWQSTAQVSGGDISCASLSITFSQITCAFAPRQQVRYIRFTTKATGAAAATLNVYEIQATGY